VHSTMHPDAKSFSISYDERASGLGPTFLSALVPALWLAQEKSTPRRKKQSCADNDSCLFFGPKGPTPPPKPPRESPRATLGTSLVQSLWLVMASPLRQAGSVRHTGPPQLCNTLWLLTAACVRLASW
jgi:hypothetical protein